MQYSCRVELWPGVGLIFYTENVIIKIAVRKLVAILFDTSALAIGKKKTIAA